MSSPSLDKLRKIALWAFIAAIILPILIVIANAVFPSKDADGNDWGGLFTAIIVVFTVPALVINLIFLLLGKLKSKFGYVMNIVSIGLSTFLDFWGVYFLVSYLIGAITS